MGFSAHLPGIWGLSCSPLGSSKNIFQAFVIFFSREENVSNSVMILELFW